MRWIHPLIVAVLVLGATPSATAAEDAGFRDVEVPVEATTDDHGGGDIAPCEGFAPMEPHCRRSWVLTDDFTFVVSMTFDYVGSVNIQGWTNTGTVTVVCPQFPFDCYSAHTGVFIEGQTFTMVVTATGAGYWKVSVR